MTSARDWAQEEFGGADLGDGRRTRRLVALAAEAAASPAGTVTGVCQSGASREGAFRLLENPAVHPSAVREPVFDATGRRCMTHGRVFVAVDGSVLSVTDEVKSKGLGD